MKRKCLPIIVMYMILLALLPSLNTFVPTTTGHTNTTVLIEDITMYQQASSYSLSLLTNGKYHNLSEVYAELDYFNQSAPELIDYSSIGESYYNNSIPLITLTNELIPEDTKGKTYIVAHHHAREQCTIEHALRLIRDLVNEYGKNESTTKLLDRTIIYIIVTLNPDALDYVLYHNPWHRKTMQPYDEDGDGEFDEDPPEDVNGDGIISSFDLWDHNGTETWEDDVFIDYWLEGYDNDKDGLVNEDHVGGADLNRNFPVHWNDSNCDSGSTSDMTADDWQGPAALSEKESQALVNFVQQHNFVHALSLHSGTNVTIFDWGYTYEEHHSELYMYYELTYELYKEKILPESFFYEEMALYYTVAGDWADWTYADEHIIPMTLEIYTNGTSYYYLDNPAQYYQSEIVTQESSVNLKEPTATRNRTDYTVLYLDNNTVKASCRHDGIWRDPISIYNGNDTDVPCSMSIKHNGTHFFIALSVNTINTSQTDYNLYYLEADSINSDINKSSFELIIEGGSSDIDPTYVELTTKENTVFIAFNDLATSYNENFLISKTGVNAWEDTVNPTKIGTFENESSLLDLFYSTGDNTFYTMIANYGNTTDEIVIYSTNTPQNSTSWVENPKLSPIRAGFGRVNGSGALSEYKGTLKVVYPAEDGQYIYFKEKQIFGWTGNETVASLQRYDDNIDLVLDDFGQPVIFTVQNGISYDIIKTYNRNETVEVWEWPYIYEAFNPEPEKLEALHADLIEFEKFWLHLTPDITFKAYKVEKLYNDDIALYLNFTSGSRYFNTTDRPKIEIEVSHEDVITKNDRNLNVMGGDRYNTSTSTLFILTSEIPSDFNFIITLSSEYAGSIRLRIETKDILAGISKETDQMYYVYPVILILLINGLTVYLVFIKKIFTK